jgi:hypothetical protein
MLFPWRLDGLKIRGNEVCIIKKLIKVRIKIYQAISLLKVDAHPSMLGKLSLQNKLLLIWSIEWVEITTESYPETVILRS